MYKVVIVDDEPRIVRYLQNCISWDSYGCSIALATTEPKDALSYITDHKVDLLITDINMGDMTGLELIRQMRMLRQTTRCIILSGYDDFEYAKEAMSLGAMHYLTKPLDKKELVDILSHLGNPYSYMSMVEAKPIDEVLDYIHEHFETPMSLSDIAEHFHYSNNYVCDLFKKNISKTFTEYLLDYRMKKAKEMLTDQSLNITEIALAVGYKDYSYFTRVFKKHSGYSPSQYRKDLFND